MATFLDFLLVVYGLYCAFRSFKKICFEKNTSIVNFVIGIVFVFCIAPILLNYLVGIPTYEAVYWYKIFIPSMTDKSVSTLYDIYILLSLISLQIYSNNYTKKGKNLYNPTHLHFKGNFLSLMIASLPFLFIILSGTYEKYLSYGTQSLRGFDIDGSSYFTILIALIFLSLFFSYGIYFNGKKKSRKQLAIFIIYNLLIIWIVGKRFIIANIIIAVLFYLSNSDLSKLKRERIYKFLPLTLAGLLLFSGFYLTTVKPLSDTSISSVYDMLRVDFGRDDVIKYTIDKEIIKDERILDYRAQTFIGLLFQLVPRSLWPQKPYPHYMYLTSSLLGVKINKLPAGTTPSLYEMTISNFGVLGFILAILGLVVACRIADKVKNVDIKYILLTFITVILTQSLDIYIVYIFILFFIFIVSCLRAGSGRLNTFVDSRLERS